MEKSESIKNLSISLAKFQEKVKNPANTAKNPFFKSKYAPLDEVLNTVRPILSECGLSIIQAPSGDGEYITVTTLLLHESGEWIEPEPLTLKADKATAQGAGSAITYARRYSLSAILGISSEDDDDGNYASEQKKQKSNKSKVNKSKQAKGTISAKQQKRMFALAKGKQEIVKAVLTKYKLSSTADIQRAEYDKLCKEIEEMAKGKEELPWEG